MDKVYIIQKEYVEDKYDIDGMMLYKLLNLYARRNLDSFRLVTQEDLAKVYFGYQQVGKVDLEKSVIPIGNINFVRDALRYALNKDVINMTPIEIPVVLRQFAKRKYDIILGKFLKNGSYDTTKLFIKDATELKNWNSLLYRGSDVTRFIEDNRSYVVTDYIDIVSEYRVFVKDDEVMACQNYMGNVLVFPDVNTINQMIVVYKEDENRPKAYTLDIAVAKIDGELQTVPLEVHPFVSCGLYGYFSEDILYMLREGYSYYIKESHRS